MKWTEKEAGVLILSHVLSVGSFPIDDTKSQPFAYHHRSKQNVPENHSRCSHAAGAAETVTAKSSSIKALTHTGQMQEQGKVWSNFG